MAGSLEDRLCRTFGYEHVALAGWARGAMVALFETLDLSGAPFVFPANICPAVLAAGVAARLRPAPVAVAADSGLAEDASLAEAITAVKTRGVVMPTHLYGARLTYPKTLAAARAHGWFVLENDTMATTTAAGKPTAFGDALLLSFGHDKTLDAGGGGALLTNDAQLAAAMGERIAAWPQLSDAAEATETELALARRHLRAAGTPAGAEDLFVRDLANVRYALPATLRPAIVTALDRLGDVVQRKRDKLALWDSALKDLEGELLKPSWSPQVPWRVIRRLRRPHLRKSFADTVRACGFDVGHNYPSLAESYPVMLAGALDPSQDTWGQSVVNFWLTDRYDAAHIAAAARAMTAFFTEHA